MRREDAREGSRANILYYQLLCKQILRGEDRFSNKTFWYLIRQKNARESSRTNILPPAKQAEVAR